MCKTCKTCFLSGTKTNLGLVNNIGEYTCTTDEIYHLTVEGDSIFVTGNHYVMTNLGMKKVELLRLTDILKSSNRDMLLKSIDIIRGSFDIYSVKNNGQMISVGNSEILFADEQLNEELDG